MKGNSPQRGSAWLIVMGTLVVGMLLFQYVLKLNIATRQALKREKLNLRSQLHARSCAEFIFQNLRSGSVATSKKLEIIDGGFCEYEFSGPQQRRVELSDGRYTIKITGGEEKARQALEMELFVNSEMDRDHQRIFHIQRRTQPASFESKDP